MNLHRHRIHDAVAAALTAAALTSACGSSDVAVPPPSTLAPGQAPAPVDTPAPTNANTDAPMPIDDPTPTDDVITTDAATPTDNSNTSDDIAPPSDATPTSTATPSDDSADAPTSTPDRLGASAAADLAERLGIDPEAVAVVSIDEVTWPDSSLGCPQKGMMYTQVLTPGIRIVLEANGLQYRYHAGNSRDPFYCAAPQEPVGGATSK